MLDMWVISNMALQESHTAVGVKPGPALSSVALGGRMVEPLDPRDPGSGLRAGSWFSSRADLQRGLA